MTMQTAPPTTTRPSQSPAEGYQQFFGPAIFEPLADHVMGRARPGPGERVLDLACGTGILTRRLAAAVAPGGRVTGIDLNPAMLAVARSIDAPPATPIEWRQADGTATGLPDGGHDLVTCQQGLQFFPDCAAGVAEMHRLLDAGGRVALALWRGPEHHPLHAGLADAEEPRLRRLGADLSRQDLERPFSLGEPDAVRALLADAGFGDILIDGVTVQAHFPTPERFVERLEYAYAAVVPALAADPERFAAHVRDIVAETRDLVEAHRRGDHVVVPMHSLLVTARRR